MTAISFTSGVAITYVLSMIWVFKTRVLNNRGVELAVFGTIGVVGMGLVGRMEYGPRSLGARSILGDAQNAETQSIMNWKIKFRESFRPFAP